MNAEEARLRQHNRHVQYLDLPVDACPRCQRGLVVCSRKVRMATWDGAQGMADVMNQAEPTRPVWPYVCCWCNGFHVTSNLRKAHLRRLERRRRKRLVALAEAAA